MRVSHRALILCLSALFTQLSPELCEAKDEPRAVPSSSSDGEQGMAREPDQDQVQSSSRDQSRDQGRDQSSEQRSEQGAQQRSERATQRAILRIDSARPALLQEGQSLGVGVDYLYELWRSGSTRPSPLNATASWRGGVGLSLGVRSVSEGSLGWEVSHLETRGALLGSIFRSMGRGAFGLVLGLGGVALSEEQVRHQSERFKTAGLDASLTESLVQSAYTWLWSATLRPTAQLEVTKMSVGSSETMIGITLSGELEYRLIPVELSAQLGDSDPLGWGINAGVYVHWGQ